MRITSMKKIREVLELHVKMNLSSRKTERSVGVPRSTILDYASRFKISDLDINKLDEIDDDLLYSKLFDNKKKSTPKYKKPLPDYNYIYNELKNSKKSEVTVKLLWEEYREVHPKGYEYTQFRILYNRFKNKLNPSMRQVHIAGDKVFVDYSGLTMPIYNAKTGEVDKAQIFVAVLGASGYTFVHASMSQKQEDFINSHVLAYSFFGGTPRSVVPDNLKSAIISNNKNGIVVNESYKDLARHYAMIVEPARPYKPKDKSKAEQGVLGIQRYILARLRHQKFFCINELNDSISGLLDDYNNKIVKHLEKSRTEMFLELEKAQLRALPANSYMYKQFKVARVNQDYHISLLKCNYSVPFKYLKEEVEVKYSINRVEIFHKNKMIATHPRLHRIGESSSLTEHMPKEHDYIHQNMNPQRLRSWAKDIGEYSLEFVEDAFKSVEHPPNAYRKIIGVLSLAKLYGKTELELALMYALDQRALKTKSIKSILDKKLYLGKCANNTVATKSLFNTHENLRGADEYK